MFKKRGRTKNKKGQEIFGLSFGMIFAVILIIFFVIIAFFVIKQFLCTRDCAKIGIFYDSLNKKVEDAWNSGDITNKFSIDLSSNVEAVCFADLNKPFTGKNSEIGVAIGRFDAEDNLFLYAPKKTCCNNPSYSIKHLDLDKIIAAENPYCIKLSSGRGSLVVDMQNSDKFVKIER
jgi:hypothetical protein